LVAVVTLDRDRCQEKILSAHRPWLHLADRTVLRVHPRGDTSRPMRGVFATRSQHRPNPLGIHQVTVRAIDDLRIQVRGLEAIDRTPIIDIKPALEPRGQR
jgi:tRNA-Thr(GGU) m(6)t(6)A37 methyltransferase TsaA